MIILLALAALARYRRTHRPPAADDRSNCVTGRPCTRGCSLFCALEE